MCLLLMTTLSATLCQRKSVIEFTDQSLIVFNCCVRRYSVYFSLVLHSLFGQNKLTHFNTRQVALFAANLISNTRSLHYSLLKIQHGVFDGVPIAAALSVMANRLC